MNLNKDLWMDRYLSYLILTLNPLEEIVLDTGAIPCSVHGYDHLSRDSTCEFCKKAIGPLYRHLKKKYGMSISDQTPTLSFDFFGTSSSSCHRSSFYAALCVAIGHCPIVMGIRCTRKTKECVRSCLNDVVAELNTYTVVQNLRCYAFILTRPENSYLRLLWNGLCITILNRRSHLRTTPLLMGSRKDGLI